MSGAASASRRRRSPVLVIGAGVAGAACALRLRALGMAVDLVEKTTFPRAKVCGCCLGETGLQALSQLGLRERVRERAVRTHRWAASLGGRRVELEIPSGVAISREVLDPLMLEAAIQAGVRVRMDCAAKIEGECAQAVTVKLVQPTATVRADYRCVVIASGLRAGGVQGLLPWTELPHGPFGVSFMASSAEIDTGVIYMACHADGYVGMVKLADGRVDVAAALHSGASSAALGDPVTRVESILAASEFAPLGLTDRSAVMTTPPLRRARRRGHGRLLAIGDAAGYVEPFTGEGMTWGMQSGIAAAEWIAARQAQLQTAGDQWHEQLEIRLRRKQRTCRLVTAMLRSPVVCRIAAATLDWCPGLAAPLLRSLNKT
ncbi:MAG: NAD(P)/FAD-dependent oxidoreductase [Novipirellula sp. JB048]